MPNRRAIHRDGSVNVCECVRVRTDVRPRVKLAHARSCMHQIMRVPNIPVWMGLCACSCINKCKCVRKSVRRCVGAYVHVYHLCAGEMHGRRHKKAWKCVEGTQQSSFSGSIPTSTSHWLSHNHFLGDTQLYNYKNVRKTSSAGIAQRDILQ